MLRHRDEYYPLFKKGHLLEEGGIADQPARSMDLLRTWEALEQRSESRLREILHPKDAQGAAGSGGPETVD